MLHFQRMGLWWRGEAKPEAAGSVSGLRLILMLTQNFTMGSKGKCSQCRIYKINNSFCLGRYDMYTVESKLCS